MQEYKVVITARSFGKTNQNAYECLQKNGCNFVKIDELPERERREKLKDADALIAGLEEINADLMDSCPKLKIISRYGVGYDRVDIESAKERGIAVTVTPGANGDSVADLAVALMLSAARGIPQMDASVKNRKQNRKQGIEMCEKTLGVIGAGHIGQEVARRCKGFRMRILACDVFQDEKFVQETRAEYVDLDKLLKEADFITVHIPYQKETKNLISARELSLMKPEAILINTARGGIIDEDALYEALKSGRIRAAALDATKKEPPYDSPLMECENCILTPHAGAATKEASSRMSLMAAQNVVDILMGRECPNRVC